jgi:hypothetical protein
VHWVSLSGAGEDSLVALSSGNQPLFSRGRAGTNGTTLFLTSAIAGPAGELSLSSMPGYEIPLTQNDSIGGAFQLRIAAKNIGVTQ